MRYLTKVLFLSMMGFLLTGTIFSQSIKPLPTKYRYPTRKPSQDNSVDMHAWKVYSDRPNNQTVKDLNTKSPFKKLKFAEEFFVVDEVGDYIHIYKDNDEENVLKRLGPYAEDYGWVKKEDMQLSSYSLINEDRVAYKAMLLNTLYFAKGNLTNADFKQVQFYQDPELTIPADYKCDIYKIFYVYKFSPSFPLKPKSVLLGTDYVVAPGYGGIKGWVDFSRVTAWDHRISVIPNTADQAIAERKQKNIRATVFAEDREDLAKKFQSGQFSEISGKDIWSFDSLKQQEQFNPYEMRFPVLLTQREINQEKGIVKIGIIGDVRTMSNKTISKAAFATIQRKESEGSQKLSHINVVFVIDGTLSMEKYFAGTSEAIIESMRQISQETRNSYSFAAIVYRDKDDGKDLAMQPFQLTDDYRQVASWLSNQQAIDKGDKDAPEAVYYGLRQGLRYLNLPTDEINYVILVGDAGDHGMRSADDFTFVSQKDVISVLQHYNCYFMALQVNNPGTAPYNAFIDQTRQILNALMGYQYSLNKEYNEDYKNPPPTPLSKPNGRKWEFENPSFNGFVIQSTTTPLPPATLTKEIVEAILGMDEKVTSHINLGHQLVIEGAVNDSKMDNEFITYLRRAEIPAANIRDLMANHAQLYLPGYTSDSVNGIKYPIWQNELLFSLDELGTTIQIMRKLITSGTGEDLRKNIYNAWVKILQDHVGSKTLAEIEQYRVEEIELMVFGGVGNTPLLKNKLGDFRDKAKIPDPELQRFQDQVHRKLAALERIFNTSTEAAKNFSFLSGDIRYFWIPQNLLP